MMNLREETTAEAGPNEPEVDFSGYAREAEASFDAEKAKVDAAVNERQLVLSLVGNVNAGKSATINALTGRRYADVKPVAGWTKNVARYPLPGFPNVFIADTPGLEDVDERVSARTETFVEKDADAVLFFVNASVGVTRPERDAFMRMRASRRPVLPIVNKIDLLDEEDRRVVLEDVRAKLGLGKNEPLFPISAKKGEGVPELTAGIAALLEKSGKDLLFARIVRYKESIADQWVNGAAAAAFALGIAPIPGSDTVPLTALQVALCIKLAHLYGHEVTRQEVVPLITEIAAGQVGKAIFRTILKAAGWAFGPIGAVVTSSVAGVVAGAMTFGVGKAAQAWYRSNMTLDVPDLRRVFQQGSQEYREFKPLKAE